MKEKWAEVTGYNGRYKVSTHGQVVSFAFGRTRILKGAKVNRTNAIHVRLCMKGDEKDFSVHRLVATAFIPNPENKPQVNHIDGDRTNNRLENLEWCTGSENVRHAFRTGLSKPRYGESNNKTKLKDYQILEIREKYSSGKYSQRGLAREYGITQCQVHNIVTNKQRIILPMLAI